MSSIRPSLQLIVAFIIGIFGACGSQPIASSSALDGGGLRDGAAETLIGDAAVARTDSGTPASSSEPSGAWKFVMVADTHVTETGAPLPDLVLAIASEQPELVLVGGDIVQSGKGTTPAEMKAELSMFHQFMAPLRAQGIPVYPVRGNHEADAIGSASAWQEGFSGSYSLPTNGPAGEQGLSYSVMHKNALFVAVDEYVTLHQVNQAWLDSLLASNALPHVFVFGHEPAFKYFHDDCLDDNVAARDTFWSSLSQGRARVYLAGHDHFRDLSRIDDGDGRPENDLYQYIVGTGGGPFPPAPGALNGENGPYTPISVSHAVENGYLLVQVSGDGPADLEVAMTFKRRDCDMTGRTCTYAVGDEVLRYTAQGRSQATAP